MTDQQPHAPAPEKKNGRGIGGILAAIVAIGLLFYACSGNKSNTTTRPPAETITLPDGRKLDRYDAEAMCTIRIKEQLVSPATAKFQRPGVNRTGNQWRVSFDLDSQNSFGALIRSQWLCIIDGTADTISAIQQR